MTEVSIVANVTTHYGTDIKVEKYGYENSSRYVTLTIDDDLELTIGVEELQLLARIADTIESDKITFGPDPSADQHSAF